MSWLDKINNGFIITCGNGSVYRPLWLNAIKAKEYNASEFEFINIAGTLAVRKSPKGRKYNIEIIFQGDNHLDIAENFEDSADDPRPWNISHPFYGELIVQPLNLTFDNKDYNVSKITGMIVETISASPKLSINAQDQVSVLKNRYDDLTLGVVLVQIPKPKTATINRFRINTLSCYNQGVKGLKNTLDSQDYINAFNTANDAINKFTSQPLAAVRAIQAFINKPFQFVDTVKNRIDILGAQFELLRSTLATLFSPADKAAYEFNAGTLVSSIATASVTSPDYVSRDEVISAISRISTYFDLYVADLDALQTDTGGDPDSYIADADGLIDLSNLINYTISNLFTIAISAKQQRTIYLSEDSNLILLAHRYYGLDVQDSTMTQMMELNNIGLNEMLLISKGRKIIYYV